MNIKKIEWKEGKYGFEYGYIGKIRMFSIGMSDSDSYKYVLRPSLPGIKDNFEFPNREQAREKAQEILKEFVEYIQEN